MLESQACFFRPATLLRRGSKTGVFLWILQNFWEHVFRRTSERCSVIKRNRWDVLLSISCFHAQTCTTNMRRGTHIQCWISNRSVAFTWNSIWKLTEMSLKKVISPSGQVYLNVYMFRNDMNSYRSRFHIGYFDRFEIQHPIWVALRMFVVQVRAWKHENW